MNQKIVLLFLLLYLISSGTTLVYAQSNTSFTNVNFLQSEVSRYANIIELGLGNIGQSSFELGEYNGLEEQGGIMIGNIVLNSGSWTLKGLNLGLDSRSLFAEYAKQGLFKVHFDYAQLKQHSINDASTPFLNAGSSNQALPANWVAANTTSGMTNLLSNLQFYDLETERRGFATGLSWFPADKWELSGRYQHEVKQGSDLLAGAFGTNGGNSRSALLIQPIDYVVDDYTISLNYAEQRTQFSITYHLSLFSNDNNALVWDNPFLRVPTGNTWAVGTDYAASAQGQISLMPSNQAKQLTFSGAYSFENTARLSANISLGNLQQDEPFLPYTINSNLNVPNALPRSQLDAQIDTSFINIGFYVRPTKKLDIKIHYTFDNRDNNTPRDLYLLVHNDSANQGSILSSNARINTPYGFEIKKFKIDVGYRLVPAHKLIIGFAQEQYDRTFTEVETTKEQTVKMKLQSRFSDTIGGHIEGAQSDRAGSEYISNRPYLQSHNPDYITTLTENNRYINDPLLRKFNYADHKQNELATAINFVINNSLTLELSAQQKEKDYTQSTLGLKQSEDSNATIHTTYTTSKTLDGYLFFTRETMTNDQMGYQRAATNLYPGIMREPPLCASCGFWSLTVDDAIDTAGMGLNWKTWENRLKLAAAYTYSEILTHIQSTADVNVNDAPLPRLDTRFQSLNITADFKIKEKMDFRLRYLYQKEQIQNFAVDNITPNTLSFIIYPGSTDPDYSSYVIGLSFIYKY